MRLYGYGNAISASWYGLVLVGFYSFMTTLALSAQAVAAVTATSTLGSTGSTDLQILTGDFVQQVCGGFIQNGGADSIDTSAVNAAQQFELFDKCHELMQTANRLTASGGPVESDLGITLEQLNSAVQNVAAEEAAAIGSYATELSTNQAKNISKRVAGLLSLKGGFRLSIANLNGHDVLPVLQPGDEDSAATNGALLSNRWSVFTNGIAGRAEKDETEGEDGFESTLSGFTLGADYRRSPNSVLGAAFGYDGVSSDFTTSNNVAGGGLDLESATISAFGLWIGDLWYADAIITFGTADYELERRIVVQSTAAAAAAGNDGFNSVVLSSTESTQLGAAVSTGLEYTAGATSLAPYARISSVTIDVDGYDEQGGGGLALRVRDQSVESVTAVVGMRAARAISTRFGVLSPQVNVEYIHEFRDDSRGITSLYVNDPQQNELTIFTDSPDRDYFKLGLAISSVLKYGWQIFGDIKTVVNLDTVSGSVLTLGARKEF